MIGYDLKTTKKEDCKIILEKHSYTPNLDKSILELFIKAQEIYKKYINHEKKLRQDGINKKEASKKAMLEFPYIAIQDELNKQIIIKVNSSLKQKRERSVKS